MSDLLNSASLVLIPSGYKEDTVYSVVPSDGNGDLSFTRASNGTRVNSAGLVEDCPWNIMTYSEQFDNGIWSKTGISITANDAIAPNGTTTADKIASNVASGAVEISQYLTLLGGVSYCASVYMKKGSGNTEMNQFDVYNLGGAYSSRITINFGTGTITQTVGTGATVENVGNGWYRISAPFTGYAGGNYIYVGSSGDNFPSGQYVYAWGAQLNIGSTAKPYFPTTDRLNVPRLTYQNGGGGCPSLLLEKQSTNELSYSEELDNGFWTPLQITIAANNTTSPDGTQNAEKITEDPVSGVHLFYNTSSVTSASTSTASIFYKKGTRRYFSIKLQIGSNSYTQVFDADGLTTGSNSSNGLTSVSTSIVSMGNGWVRASVTGTDPSASTACYMICSLSNSATPTFDSGNFNPSYLGSSSEYGFFWGAQCEASSYPTSYIPTTSSSATRVADACSKTGISSLIGQTEGVVFWDIQVDIAVATGLGNILNIDGGSFNNTIYLYKVPAGNIVAEMYVSSVVQASFTLSSITAGRYKMALAYALNNTAFFVNGTQVGTTDTSCTVPAMSRLQMGNGELGQSDGKINQAVLFTTRLSNSDLIALTTI